MRNECFDLRKRRYDDPIVPGDLHIHCLLDPAVSYQRDILRGVNRFCGERGGWRLSQGGPVMPPTFAGVDGAAGRAAGLHQEQRLPAGCGARRPRIPRGERRRLGDPALCLSRGARQCHGRRHGGGAPAGAGAAAVRLLHALEARQRLRPPPSQGIHRPPPPRRPRRPAPQRPRRARSIPRHARARRRVRHRRRGRLPRHRTLRTQRLARSRASRGHGRQRRRPALHPLPARPSPASASSSTRRATPPHTPSTP